MKHHVTLSCVLSLGVSACASFGSSMGGDVEVTYGADADDNMSRGEKAMASKSYPEAARYFEHVKTKYPYLEAAKTAELRLGDADFERDRFAEARDRYQTFVRLHPTHAMVDYAAFRAALTHYRDMPSDFFLLPPPSEKEQTEVRGALKAMSEFIASYPDSKYLPEARKALVDVKHRLAEHEVSVAEFYARRGRWPAVIGRFNTVLQLYGGSGFDERAALGLAEAYQKLGEPAKAAAVLREFLAKFPDGPGAQRASAALATLTSGAAPAVGSAPDAGR